MIKLWHSLLFIALHEGQSPAKRSLGLAKGDSGSARASTDRYQVRKVDRNGTYMLVDFIRRH